ncbi:MAG: hypothetical protein WDO71_10365 [Bacteroidota bacterium]
MKRFLFLSSIIAVVIGCQKELSHSSSSYNYQSLSEFFEKNQKPSQTFSQNSSNIISLQTNKGTKIIFQPNSFITLNDQPVTGDISIEVKEILTPSEMILNRTLTVSNGQPIESGGEFFVRVTKNGQELKLAPGYGMQIKLPSLGVSMNNMQVFNGQVNNADAGNKVNWVPNTNPGNAVIVDTFGLSRTLFADSVNWINCDRFLNDPRINYTVNPGNISGLDSLTVVVHFTGRNSVISMPWNSTALKFYSQSLIASDATVIGIGIRDHKILASIVPVTLQNDQSITLNLLPITEAQLKERLVLLH